MQMHTVVTPPLTPAEWGSVSCRPMGQEPIQFDWSGGAPGALELDESGSEATSAAPGRYRVRATDANGEYADVVVDVSPMYERAVVVREYRVRPASTSHSRDGEVVVVGSGLDDPSIRLLWTSGVETSAPRLADVPCGTYSVVAVAADPRDDAPVTVHACAPARVGVALSLIHI